MIYSGVVSIACSILKRPTDDRTHLHLHLFTLVGDLLDAVFNALAEQLLAFCRAVFMGTIIHFSSDVFQTAIDGALGFCGILLQ